jgi:energy-coupling factor transporter transmembrane protein EcfT
MKSLKSPVKLDPVVKILAFIDLNILIFFGSIYISLFIGFWGYLFLGFYKNKNRMLANPHKTLIYCILTFLFVYIFFDNTKEELISLFYFTSKLFAIIILSVIAGILIGPFDLIILFKSLRVRDQDIPVIYSVFRFIPVTINDLSDIVFSQRSRGLRFNFKSVFKLSTYLSVIIPYLSSILDHVIQTEISITIKKFPYKFNRNRISVFDIFILLFCLILWMVPHIKS